MKELLTREIPTDSELFKFSRAFSAVFISALFCLWLYPFVICSFACKSDSCRYFAFEGYGYWGAFDALILVTLLISSLIFSAFAAWKVGITALLLACLTFLGTPVFLPLARACVEREKMTAGTQDNNVGERTRGLGGSE